MKHFLITILSLLLLLAVCIGLWSCSTSSRSWALEIEKYTHIYIETYKAEGHCYTVEEWLNRYSSTSTYLLVSTKEAGNICVSSGFYILFESAEVCPYCE